MKGQNHYGQSLSGESVNRKKYSPLHPFSSASGGQAYSPIHPFTDKSGFTLIETIMVMVIAVILAAVVAVRWSPFDTIKLNSATRKVAADIRYAQKVAISTQATYAAIAFNTNGYSVYQKYASSTLVQSPSDPCSDSGGYFTVDFTADRCSNYSGVTITTVPPNDVVQFNSLGTPLDTFASVITINKIITVNYEGSKPITIEAGTGRVSY